MSNIGKITVILFATLTFFSNNAFTDPVIEVSPGSIDFGYVLSNTIIEKTAEVKNIGDKPLSVSGIRVSCNCVEAEITNRLIKPNSKARLDIKLNTDQKKVDGRFKKYVYIQSDDPKKLVSRIEVKGTALRNPRPDGKVEIDLYYSEGCKDCEEIRSNILSRLRQEYPERLIINEHEISNMDNYVTLMGLEKHHKIRKNVPMTLFVANTYLLGKKEIRRDLNKIVRVLIGSPAKPFSSVKSLKNKNGQTPLGNKEKLIDRFKSFSIITIMGAGLADGINPCAFATIIFLISFLAFAGRAKREILIISASFGFAVFLTYCLIGFGIFKILMISKLFKMLSKFIYYSAAVIAFILGSLSLWDAIAYFKNKNAQAIKLKLPKAVKEKIRLIIREKLKTRGLVFSALSAGFLVSLLESVCTGQLYLPTIIFITKEPTLSLQAYFYLLLYNIMFIIPLAIVAILSYFGVNLERSGKLRVWSVPVSKILLATVFFGLALVLIFM